MLSGARAFTCTLFGKRVILLGHRKSLRYVLIVVARMPSLSLLSALLSHTQCDARSYVPVRTSYGPTTSHASGATLPPGARLRRPGEQARACTTIVGSQDARSLPENVMPKFEEVCPWLLASMFCNIVARISNICNICSKHIS